MKDPMAEAGRLGRISSRANRAAAQAERDARDAISALLGMSAQKGDIAWAAAARAAAAADVKAKALRDSAFDRQREANAAAGTAAVWWRHHRWDIPMEELSHRELGRRLRGHVRRDVSEPAISELARRRRARKAAWWMAVSTETVP